MEIDFIYIINLRSSKEEIKHKLEQIPWSDKPDYHIIDAINGWEVIKDPAKSPYKFKLADWWKIDSDEEFYKREVLPGEMGCTLSHYHCIELAHKAGYNNVLILEEDFISSGNFPTKEMFDTVPKDASIIYLGRIQKWHDEWETMINNNITKVGYSWGAYSYIVTKKGMKEVLESTILDNIITPDEFFPAINGTSDRKDAIQIFENIDFQAYSFNEKYFTHSSNNYTSSTENNPNTLKVNKHGSFVMSSIGLNPLECNKVIDFIEKNIKESDKIINHKDKKGFSEVDALLFKTVSNSIKDFIIDNIKDKDNLLSPDNRIFFDIKDSGYELIKISSSTELQPGSVDVNISQNKMTFNISSLIMSLKDTGNEIVFPDLNIKIPLGEGTVIFLPPYWTHCYYINSTEQKSYIVKTNITNKATLKG